MGQTYHIEVLGFSERGQAAPVLQRQSVWADALQAVQRRAVNMLRRSQMPQWTFGKVEAVRVTEGTGSEIFRWSLWDEMSGARLD